MARKPFNPAQVIFFVLFFLAACSGPDEPASRPDVDVDTGHDVGTGDDATSSDATPPDGGDDADEPPQPCTYQFDCPTGSFCHEGACAEAPSCGEASEWRSCVQAFDAIEEGLGRRAVCRDDFCELVCLHDGECPDGHTCSDHGRCLAFDGEITGVHPGGGERGPLEVGVANVLMKFPIGLSMGGYGSRATGTETRYTRSLRASAGQMHGLYARALALDNGERELVLIRLPIIFPSGALHEAVARALQAETGADWRDSLVISGTHTHSGPTRFWHLPEEAMVRIGSFGTDEFSQEAFDWLVETTVEAARAARADRAPARMGWDIFEAFDMDDQIASDRWGETPPFDDNRLLTLRVDDLDGTPRAILISFGSHGTFNDSDYFTGDALSGIERAVEAAMGERFDRHVPVLYFNQNGGSMSPRGDGAGHRSAHVYESLGYRFVERTFERMLGIETTTDWEFRARTHRFPLTYEFLGYESGEWVARNSEYIYGGLQCMLGGDQDYSTHADIKRSACLGAHDLAFNRPITMLAKSQITALQFNDLTVVTLPGEPAMEVGWQVQRELRDTWGLDPLKSFVWGYAQDHLLYITPTNLRGERPPFPGISLPMAPDDYPDFALSYLQGGYEAASTPWGFRMGDFIVARAVEAVGLLLDASIELELPATLPEQYSRRDEAPFPVDLTDAARVGTVTIEPPEEVSRLEAIEFGWIGGDPGAEMPQAPRVVLQREVEAGEFVTVTTPSRRPYDNREFLMLTRVRPNDGDWEWLVYWEELKDFPTGTYRFLVEGHYQQTEGAAGRVPYEVVSRPFAFVAHEALEVELGVTPAGGDLAIAARLAYPAAPQLEFTRALEDRGLVSGSFRMRHPHVGSNIADPLVVGEDVGADDVTLRVLAAGEVVRTLTGAALSLATQPEHFGGRANVPVTRLSAAVEGLAAGSYTVELEVVDVHGNRGRAEAAVEVP